MPRSKTKTERLRQIWKKTNGICSHCGKHTPGNLRTVDHYIARANGGTDDLRNLMPLCKPCNKAKGCKVIEPYDYYKYASMTAINKCVEYERDFIAERTTMDGLIY